MTAYYNEIDPYAAQWLRNLISKNLIAPGDVDERSIVDVHSDDLIGYDQCHFFAGIGGWSLAARLAGWPDERPLWTGSCPCQPFSVAGKGEGKQDERHLWPTFFGLISARRPPVVMGEQVAAAVGKDWLDGVHSDLEGVNYACGAAVVPACAVDAPHRRDRLWFVAHPSPHGRQHDQAVGGINAQGVAQAKQGVVPGADGWNDGSMADSDAPERREVNSLCGRMAREHTLSQGQEAPDRPFSKREDEPRRNSTAWSGAEWIGGFDGKARRAQPSIRLLAHGVPARVGRLRAYGNAIVPQVAAEIMSAYVDAYGLPERVAA